MIFSKPFYYILNLKDHHLNKKKILSMISHKGECVDDGYSVISKTDWNNQERENFNWYSFSLSKRDSVSYSKFLYDGFKKREALIKHVWFNQYDPSSGSSHIFHNHYSESDQNDLAAIYYIELEDKSLRTILKHPKTGKEIIPRVKEGQILTFDARIPHMSPPNFSNSRKTVLSFNLRFL